MARLREQVNNAAIAFEAQEQIVARMDDFTPRQRVFAEYILQNPESLAFLSIRDLAQKAGVSQATIVRFCTNLGYEGYAQLAREVQQAIQVELGNVGRFHMARQMHRESGAGEPRSTFERIVAQESENLLGLSANIKIADFYRCLEMMEEADRFCIVGCLSSANLASFFGDMLGKVTPQVDVLRGHQVMTSNILRRMGPQSLMFLIAFPRYPRQTVQLGELAAARGARIVAITNSHISPVVPLADLVFLLPVGIPSFVDAYAAPIVFINALVTEFSERIPEQAQAALGDYDRYASRLDLFLYSGNKPQSALAAANRTKAGLSAASPKPSAAETPRGKPGK
jgi:DNA-binding MurR/RpiR family transcriptional regulator